MESPIVKTLALVALLLAGVAPCLAEPLPIDRAFDAPAINGDVPHDLQLAPGGAVVTYLKPQAPDSHVMDLWSRPSLGGAERLVMRGVAGYAWDPAGKRLLVTAGGHLWLAAPDGAAPVALNAAGDDARFSPGGGLVTYVRDHNLHAIDLASGQDRALTSDGRDTLSYGVAEFIASDDMYRSTGTWASPDDRLVAYARVDEAGVEKVVRTGAVKGLEVATVEERYPRPGRPNAIVDLYVQPAVGGRAVKVDLGGDPDVYLARVDWSRDARTLYVQRETRDQTTLDLLGVDPATGAAKVLLREHQMPWVRIDDDFKPLGNGDFIWGSERTGFRHLYLYHRDGTLVRAITHGDWPVTHMAPGPDGISPIVGIDEARRELYFLASKDTPLEQQLYAVSYGRAEEPRRITAGAGWWTVQVARDARTFLGTYNDPHTPPRTGLYAIDGRRLAWIAENRLDAGHAYAAYLDHRSYPEFGTLTAEDGQVLHYSITRPHGFDPAKRYPAIVNVYGGPEVTSMVRKVWAAPTDQLLTQAGYVLFRIDNRGTFNRGAKFEAPINRRMGGAELADQLLGKRYLASLPYVDPGRIGVMGWSYGGYMTLRLLTEPGAGFRAGAAGGVPSDWRLYESHYTEHYMGDPRTGKDAYDAASLLPRLDELARPGAPRLLLLHGMADDNVLMENAVVVMDRLQKLAVPFDLMLYPGEAHHVADVGKQIQLWKTYLEFFDRNLKPAG
jgi:dipeptidyl-peptidase 4